MCLSSEIFFYIIKLHFDFSLKLPNHLFAKRQNCMIMLFCFYLMEVIILPWLCPLLSLLLFISLFLQLYLHYLHNHIFCLTLPLALFTSFIFKFYCIPMLIHTESLFVIRCFFQVQHECMMDISGFMKSPLEQKLKFITTVLFLNAIKKGLWPC